MQLEVGEIFEGKVTGITKFGAFVAMPDGKNGLVHISEIANTFVNDINDFVKEGEMVKVKVIGIGEGGKVNLSIKQLLAPSQPRQNRPRPAGAGGSEGRSQQPPRRSGGYREERKMGQVTTSTGDVSFEDKLKQFMQESDSRIADNKMYADHKSSRRRR